MPIYSDEMPAEIDAIVKARANLDSLAGSGLITDVEHRYLKCELSMLIESLNHVRTFPIILKQLASPKASLARTIKRVPALKGLASTKRISLEAWRMVSPEITNDLQVLATGMSLGDSGLKWADENSELFYEACEYVRKISKRAKGSDLARDKAWIEFVRGRGLATDGIFQYLGVSRLLGRDGRGTKELQKIQSQLMAFKRAGRLSEPMVALFKIEHSVSRDILLPAADKLKAKTEESKGGYEIDTAVRRMTLRKNALSAISKSPRIRPMVIRDALAIVQADYDVLSGRIEALLDGPDGATDDKQGKTHMPASIEADILALRKKIATCDRGITDLGRRYQWMRLREIWRRYEHFWEMYEGTYPFNARGQFYSLSLILEACRHLKSLETVGMLNPVEARMLNSELDKIRVGMETMHSTDDYNVTCYIEHGGTSPGSETLDEVMKRLALLEKIHAAGKLHPRVLGTVLYGMERKIPVPWIREEWGYSEDTGLFSNDEERAFPVDSVAARIDRLKKTHRAWRSRLTSDPRWIEVTGTLRFAAKVAKAENQMYKDCKTAWIRFCKAKLLARELLSDGMLTRDEAVLMNHGINSFWDVIDQRPMDAVQRRLHFSGTLLRYDPDVGQNDLIGGEIYPGYRNLGHWLDILGKATDSEKVSPVVYKEVLQQLKVILPCQRALLLKDYEDWDFSEAWETDYSDSDGLFDPGASDMDLFEQEASADTQPAEKPEEGDK
jgi:hypothetical protein